MRTTVRQSTIEPATSLDGSSPVRKVRDPHAPQDFAAPLVTGCRQLPATGDEWRRKILRSVRIPHLSNGGTSVERGRGFDGGLADCCSHPPSSITSTARPSAPLRPYSRLNFTGPIPISPRS